VASEGDGRLEGSLELWRVQEKENIFVFVHFFTAENDALAATVMKLAEAEGISESPLLSCQKRPDGRPPEGAALWGFVGPVPRWRSRCCSCLPRQVLFGPQNSTLMDLTQ